jgi:putative MATE family efflux protein
MKIKTTSRTIWAISFPVIIAGISEKIVELTDVIFLARYGIVELGAIALADAIYGVSIFLIIGLADGIQIVIARRAGQERSDEIGMVFNQGLYLLTVISVVFIVAIKYISPHLTAAIISSANVGAAVDDFLQIFAFAIVFHSVNLTYSAFYIGVSRTRVLIGATVVLAMTNIVLDYCLIFGNLGLPRLGIKGAAIASLTAEITTFAFLTLYAWRRHDIKKYGLFSLRKWSSQLTKLLMSISSPVALEALVATVRWLVFFVIIEQLGEHPLAMANIVYTCYALLLIPIEGFSETTCSMVSNLVGQDKIREIGVLLRKSMSLSSLVIFPFLSIALVWPEYVLSIFSSDPQIIDGCVNSLRVIVGAVVIVVAGEMFVSAVAGTGDTVATLVIEIILTTLILAWVYGAAVVFALPLEYIWLSEVIGWIICAALAYGWLKMGYWKRLHI